MSTKRTWPTYQHHTSVWKSIDRQMQKWAERMEQLAKESPAPAARRAWEQDALAIAEARARLLSDKSRVEIPGGWTSPRIQRERVRMYGTTQLRVIQGGASGQKSPARPPRATRPPQNPHPEHGWIL